MLKKMFWWTLRLFLIFGLLGLFIIFSTRFIFLLHAAPKTFNADEVNPRHVAIVFGAGLLRDGSAGPVLRDRVQTAADLYHAHKVDILLMSGDNRFVNHNEPEAMRQYAIQLGVPNEAIVLDYAGRRTYDTCYRAREIFQVRSAILVTQHFHMARALYLCQVFGVDSVGVEANNSYFLKRSHVYWNFREAFATLQAGWDVLYANPLPVLGEPEPIP